MKTIAKLLFNPLTKPKSPTSKSGFFIVCLQQNVKMAPIWHKNRNFDSTQSKIDTFSFKNTAGTAFESM